MITYFLKNIVFYFCIIISVLQFALNIQGGATLLMLFPLVVFITMLKYLFIAYFCARILDIGIDRLMNGKRYEKTNTR